VTGSPCLAQIPLIHNPWTTDYDGLNDPLIPTMTDSVNQRLIGNFVQILGSKFLALGGLNQKSKKTSFVVFVIENW